MSIKHGSNRFFPRAGDGGGGVVPPGAGLWTLYGGTVVGLTDITETVAIGDTAMLSDEVLLVRGGITSAPTGAGNDAFLETGANDASVVSDASSIRIIYNSTSMQAEISTNGGAYVPIASGGASPWTAGGGAITEVNPVNLVIVGSGAALTAQQFQVLGESYFQPVADSATVVQVANAAGSTLLSVDTTDSAVLVGGTVAPAFGAGFVTYQVEVQSDLGGSGFVLRSADAALTGNLLGFVESRGSVAAPTASLNLDVLGTIAFTGYGSDNALDTTSAVVVQASVDGVPGIGYVPGRIDIGTKPNGGAGPTVPRFTIRGDGFVGVAQSSANGSEIFGVTGDAYVSGNLIVDQNVDALTLSLLGSTAIFIDSDDGSTAPVSAVGHGRVRYNNGVPAWQVSVNNGAYYDLITSDTLPTIAFVQNGNSFGVDAVLGTNDAFELQFETSGTTKARITTGGALLVGATSTTYGELLNVTQSTGGSASSKASVYLTSAVTTTDSGGLIGARINATNAINSPDTAALVQGAFVRADTTGTASVQLIGIQTFAGAGASATGITASTAYGVNAVVGYDATAVSGAITTAFGLLVNHTGLGAGKTIGTINGLRVSNLGSAQVTDAIGIDIVTQSGASGLNLGIRSQSPVVIGTTNVSATESLRVSGGGALVDGTQFVASVSGAASVNSTGAAINIGNNADAFAINVGTGAAARTITIGNQTGATSVIVNAGTGNIDIGTTAQARTVRLATGAAAQTVTLGSTNATSSMTIDTGGAMNIATSATNRTINFGTAAANQTINIGSVSGTSSLNNFYGSAGYNVTQANATTGTPVGYLYTGGTHTGLASAEATDVNYNLSRTVTFGAAGGTIATQRAFRVQGPTYAAAAALTMTEVATLAVGIPVAGGNVTFTTGATAPTLPTDSGAAGGAYTIVNSPGVRVEGTTANTTVGVSLLLKNTGSNATALPSIGWQSNGNTLDATMGVQAGNAFNHQRFALLLRANSTLTPVLTISTQGGYRFTNPAPNDAATTPAGFLFTGTANGAVNTYATTVEANQVNFALNQTYTFATGAITAQRSFLIQAPTYAFSAASTITDAATVAITSAPIAGAAASFTRSMAIWVQSGISRFDGGVGVKVTPGGTSVQGLAADFRKTYDPGLVAYVAGTSVAQAYSPATGYLSILPAWWTIPPAINSGGGAGPPLNPGIRFTWSDGTTTDRFNTSTASALTETRDSIDFNKDGLAIVGLSWIVNNTSGGAASVDFSAWTTDGNQF